MSEQLNLRRAGWLLAVLLLAGAGVFFLHRFQIRRTAVQLRELSRSAEAQGHADRALRFLDLYLSFVPEDTAARANYGVLVENMIHTSKGRRTAIDLYRQVLSEEPSRHDVRMRLARLLVKEGEDFSEALTYLESLREEMPEDVEVSFLAGLCLEGQFKYDLAAKEYRRVIQFAPQQIHAYERLASLLRGRLGQPKEAGEILDQMVSANRQNHRVYLSRALQYLDEDNKKRVETDLAQARALSPMDTDVLLVCARLARLNKKIPEARQDLRKALEIDPGVVGVYRELVYLEVEDGNPKVAIAILRQGLAHSPGNPELLSALADLLTDTGSLAATRNVLAEMRRWKVSSSQVVLCQARLNVAEGQWVEAKEILEKNRPLLAAESPERLVETDLLLARCYAGIGDPELELSAYRRAAADPTHKAAQIALGQALARLGRLDEAIGIYQKLVSDPKAEPEVWITYAKLVVVRHLSLPPDDGGWSEVEQVLQNAAQHATGAADLDLFHAEVLAARRHFSEAQRVLEAAATRHPRHIEVCLALASLAARQEKLDAARAALDAAEQKFGRRVELDLARLSLAPSLELARSSGLLSTLHKHMTEFRLQDRVRLIDALAESHFRWHDLPEARRLWLKLAELQPQDLSVRLRLFNLAVEAEDFSLMERLVDDIRKIEGADGPLCHYGLASLAILRARRGEQSGFDAARQHLAAAALRRPSWPLIPASRAMIAQLEGQSEQALADYLHAVELGERRGAILRRAVQLLYERRRYAEADQLIRRLQSELRVSPELQKLAAEIALYNANPRRAFELASGAVTLDSKDWKDLLWLSQVLLATGRQAEAYTAIKRAILLGGSSGDPWLALVHYHLRLSQTKKAEEVVAEAGRTLKGFEALVVMALCFEVIGQTKKAEEKYLSAVKARPDDASVLHNLAAFYQRTGSAEKAVAPLRRLLSRKDSLPHEEVRSIRRALAVCLAPGGTYPAFQEALGLIEANLSAEPKSAPDFYAKARILGSHPGSRREALRLLEEQRDLSPEQEFYLARLHESTENWSAARTAMLNVLSREGDNPTYLRFFVEGLFRSGAISEGEIWLDRLERLAPNDPRTIALKALALAKKGKSSEVQALVERYVAGTPDSSAERLTRLRSAARLLEQIALEELEMDQRLQTAAEDLYRRAAKESAHPKDLLTLAEYLGRQQRLAEALALCEQVKDDKLADDVAASAVSIVCAASASEERFEQVDRRVRGCLQRNPSSAKLHQMLAVLQARRGRYANAEASYRLVLKQDKRSIDVRNNLVWMLVLQNHHLDEALGLLEEAMSLAGPTAGLLDTRGMIKLQSGHLSAAVEDFQEAVAQSSSAARQLHLAHAYSQTGRRQEAAQALTKARSSGGERQLLLPADQQLYRQLRGELENP